ncbi:MAG TPA: hypothetical protein VF548_01305 [Allosphingosinicella sp.]|jgi:hypothetical protein
MTCYWRKSLKGAIDSRPQAHNPTPGHGAPIAKGASVRASGIALSLFLASMLAACSPYDAQGPSADTKFLESRVLPRILEWAKGSEPELRLAPLLEGRGYDHICSVRPYDGLDLIDGKAGAPIKTFHSRFGRHFKNGYSALVATHGNDAHAIWVPEAELFLGANRDTPCFRTSSATLVRRNQANYRGVIASLQER